MKTSLEKQSTDAMLFSYIDSGLQAYQGKLNFVLEGCVQMACWYVVWSFCTDDL